MDKKILLICNTFPPAAGIGGRRWAKFSKFLVGDGYEIHVASSENLGTEISQWQKDTESSAIKRHGLHFKYRSLFLQPKNIFRRIQRKIVAFKLSFTKYSERFVTSLPNPATWEKVSDLIKKEKVQTIVVSGDPFLSFYACQLKKLTGCKVVLDYRDLWNDHSYYRTHYKLTDKQWNFFEKAENEALALCDAIITVDDHLKEILSTRLPAGKKNKLSVIHNGFDPDDYMQASSEIKDHSKTILYFAGNIASDLNGIVLDFARSFAELKTRLPGVYSAIEIRIKGKMDVDFFSQLADLKLENLILDNSFVPLPDYVRELSEVDMGIIILSREYANSFTTKFSDYLFLNKKILVLGYPGKFSESLVSSNCGEIYTPGDGYRFFAKFGQKPGAANYSTQLKEAFNLKNLTKQLVSLLESVAS